MKVNIIGFELDFASNVSFGEVYQLIESGAGKKHKFYGDKYLYFTDVKQDLVIGVLLRLKKDKNRITTKETGNDFMVDISELGSGESSTEVSLFCINPDTKKGVFYQYFGGLSIATLRVMWRPAHNKVQSAKIKDLAKEYREHNKYNKEKAREKAKEHYNGIFGIETLTPKATVDSIFQLVTSIKEFKINSKNAIQNAGKYSPQSSFIKKSKIELAFEQPAAWFEHIKRYIKTIMPATVDDDDIIRIVGETLSGEEKAFVIGDNLDEFGNFEFDKFVKKLPKAKWSDYENCKAMDILHNLVETKPIIFGRPSPAKNWRLSSKKNVTP